MTEVAFFLPVKTPTVNHLYWHRGNIKIMYDVAKRLREQIIQLIPNSIGLAGHKLKVEIDIYEDWLTKKGEVKHKDIANREKFLVDSIFKGLGIDDKFIYELTMRKIQDTTQEGALVRITTI